MYLYLNTVLAKVFAIVFVFGKFTIFVLVFKYYAMYLDPSLIMIGRQGHLCSLQVTKLFSTSQQRRQERDGHWWVDIMVLTGSLNWQSTMAKSGGTIWAALDRLSRCLAEVPDKFWPLKISKENSHPRVQLWTVNRRKPQPFSKKNCQRKLAKNDLRISRWKGRLRAWRSQRTSDVRRRNV